MAKEGPATDWGKWAFAGFALLAVGLMWRGTRPLPPQNRPAAPITPPTTKAPSVEPPAAAPPVSGADSYAATLADGELYSCTGLAVDVPPEVAQVFLKAVDAGPKAVFGSDLIAWLSGADSKLGSLLDAKRKGSSKTLRPAGISEELTKPCSDQFSRKSLATCLVPLVWNVAPKLPEVPMSLGISYFQIPGDAVMAACIAASGDWKEVARDSSDYLYAKTQASARRFQKSLDRTTQ